MERIGGVDGGERRGGRRRENEGNVHTVHTY